MLAELMLIFILANFGKDVIAESNCTPTLCKLRFELASEVHALRNYGGCNDVYLMDCICNRTIDVQFIEHPPYIYADAKTGKVVGLLVGKFIFELSSPENSMCFLFWKNTKCPGETQHFSKSLYALESKCYKAIISMKNKVCKFD